jgi:hypothetical protein
MQVEPEYEYPPALISFFPAIVGGLSYVHPNTWSYMLTEQQYGNGLYTISASPINNPESYGQWQLFADVAGVDSSAQGAQWDGWINGEWIWGASEELTLDGTYYGAWVTIQLPEAIRLTRTVLVGTEWVSYRAPRLFRIYGSQTCSNWQLLHAQESDMVYDATGNAEIKIAGNHPGYACFGLIVSALFSGGDLMDLKRWRLFGTPEEPEFEYPSTAIWYPSVVGELSYGGTNTWTYTISDQQYGNGLHTISASGVNDPSMYGQWQVFGADIPDYGAHWEGWNNGDWAWGDMYSLDGSYFGAWVTIQLPEAIRLTRTILVARPGFVNRAPRQFRIYGSQDCSNWELLHSQDGNTTYDAGDALEIKIAGTYPEYSCYGLIASALYEGGDVMNLKRWRIFGRPLVCLIQLL